MFLVRGSFRWNSGPAPVGELSELAALVRARHAGNIDYRFSIDAGDPAQIYLQEAWGSAADFAAHGQTAEVRAIGELLRRGATEPSLASYEVSSKTEIPVVLS
jgi:quinol monooxygenase YgiN